jgi:hypothetical protein
VERTRVVIAPDAVRWVSVTGEPGATPDEEKDIPGEGTVFNNVLINNSAQSRRGLRFGIFRGFPHYRVIQLRLPLELTRPA